MTHRTAALVAAAALVLTGCGDVEPAPAPTTAAETVAPGPTAPPRPAAPSTRTAYEPEPFEPAGRDDWLAATPCC